MPTSNTSISQRARFSLRRFSFAALLPLLLLASCALSTRTTAQVATGATALPAWTTLAAMSKWQVTGNAQKLADKSSLAFVTYDPLTLTVETGDVAAEAAPAVRLTTRLQNSMLAQLSWTADGKPFSYEFLLNGGDEWRSTTLVPPREGGWSGHISTLSLTLTGGAHNQMEIAAVQLLPQADFLPPAALKNGDAPLLWRRDGAVWQTRTHQLIPNAPYQLSGDATLHFLDSDGNALAGGGASTSATALSFTVPWGAATTVIEAATLEAAQQASLVQQGAAQAETANVSGEVPRAQWVSYPGDKAVGACVFRRDFTLTSAPDEASLAFTVENEGHLFINGVEAGAGVWAVNTMKVVDVKKYLRAGANRIEVRVVNGRAASVLLAELWLRNGAKWTLISTDKEWQAARLETAASAAPAAGEAWLPARELGRVPTMPWGSITYDYPGPREMAELSQNAVAWDAKGRGVRYQLHLAGSAARDVWLFARRGETVLATRNLGALSPQGKDYEGTLPLDFVAAGDAEVVLDVPYTTLHQRAIGRVDVPTPPQGFPTTHLLQTPRGPVLDIDGFRAPAHFYVASARYRFDPHGLSYLFRDAGDMNLHLQSFDAPSIDYEGNDASWTGPGAYNFSQLDELCRTALAADPQGRLLLRIEVQAPNWWIKAHPDDVALDEKGMRDNLHSSLERRQSLGSEAWQRDARAYLVALTQHLKAQPYAPRIWGMLFATSGGIEWFSTASSTDPIDYSVAGTQGWRRWLRREYTSDDKLRSAWGDDKVSLDTAKVPLSALRFAAEHGDYRDPTRGARPSVDYVRYIDTRTTDLMLDGARAIRESSDEKLEVGAFYGYHFFASTIYSFLHQAGHNDFERVLASPDMLFFAGPVSYRTRFPGEAATALSAADAAAQHGKLWVQEEDIRTYLEKGNKYSGNQYNNGRVDTFYDSVQVMRRDFGEALARGWGMWWYEMDGPWFRNPALRHEIARMRAAQDAPVDAALTPRAQIAVVVSEESVPLLKDWHGLTPQDLAINGQLQAFHRSGSPFQTVLLRDLVNGTAPSYRAYFFLDAWRVSSADRDALHARFKRDKATVLWQWGDGLFTDDAAAPSLQSASQLTGFTLREGAPGADLTHFQSLEKTAWTQGLQPAEFGHRRLQKTRLVPTDGEILGRLTDGDAALAQKAQDGWTSLYLSVPDFPEGLIRNIARAAEIHAYSPGDDVLAAGHGFLTLHANAPGTKTLNFPQQCDVWDALTNRRLEVNTTNYTYHSEAGETRIFELRKAETLH